MGKVVTLGEILIRYSTEKGQHLEDSSRLFSIMVAVKPM